MCVQMSQSLGGHLKRCSRYGTSNATPKRPCRMSSLSAASTTVNSGALCSSDKSPQDFDKDDETAGSAATAIDTPSTPCSLNQEGVNTASVANSTPRDTNSDASVKFRNAQSLEPEELRHKRTELRHSVASKEQTLHNLNLVKTHRTKVRCLKYVYRVPTHLESRGESGKVRELIWSGNFVGGQGILVAYERKERFLTTLIWSGKNYGHGRGKSGNLILCKEWESWSMDSLVL